MTHLGPVPRRLAPIFRDRDELSASGDLGGALTGALRESLFLVVVCSPAAAISRWVDEEIRAFKRLRGEERVLALIASGRPRASDRPGEEAQECFPPGLRFLMGADGLLLSELAHPIAADLREGQDGRQLAKLKLIAGLTGLRLDDLMQRETQRRVRRFAALAAASFAGMTLTGGLALYANSQRIAAVRETAKAKATSDYLVGTYKLINPATENPRSISALTLLSRGAERANVELADQPDVHVRILQTLGQAYNNLGLSAELVNILGRSRSAIRRAGPQGAGAWLQLADAYFNLDRPADAMAAVESAQQALGPAGQGDRLVRADIAEKRGKILYSESDLKGGLANLDQALGLYRRIRDAPTPKIAAALKIRGLLLSDEGRYTEAETSFLKYLDICRRTLGEKHFLTGDAWYTLAFNDVAAGKLDLGEIRIQNALAIQRAVLDADNPILADSYSVEGQILHGENKLAAAAAAFEQAISIYRKAYKRPQYSIGIALVYLALVESDMGHVDAALADIAEAKHNYDVSYGKLHPNHGDLLVNRAVILAKAGRRAEAISNCADGVEILDRTLGADAAFTKSDAAICAKL